MMNYFNEWANIASKEINLTDLEEGDIIRWEGGVWEGSVGMVLEVNPDPEWEIVTLVVKAQHEWGGWTQRMEVSFGEDDKVTVLFPSARTDREFRQH